MLPKQQTQTHRKLQPIKRLPALLLWQPSQCPPLPPLLPLLVLPLRRLPHLQILRLARSVLHLPRFLQALLAPHPNEDEGRGPRAEEEGVLKALRAGVLLRCLLRL